MDNGNRRTDLGQASADDVDGDGRGVETDDSTRTDRSALLAESSEERSVRPCIQHGERLSQRGLEELGKPVDDLALTRRKSVARMSLGDVGAAADAEKLHLGEALVDARQA